MSTKRRVALLAIAVLALLVAGVAVSAGDTTAGRLVPVVVSVVALIVSLLGAFRSEIFPFDLDVVWGDVAIAPQTASSPDDLALVLPIVFVNRGFADGVVESVAVLVHGASGARQYGPTAEVKEVGTLRGPLHQEHLERTFRAFPLPAKTAIERRIVFLQEREIAKYPPGTWEPAEYELELFVSGRGSGKPRSCGRIPFPVTKSDLDSTRAGTWLLRYPTRIRLDL